MMKHFLFHSCIYLFSLYVFPLPPTMHPHPYSHHHHQQQRNNNNNNNNISRPSVYKSTAMVVWQFELIRSFKWNLKDLSLLHFTKENRYLHFCRNIYIRWIGLSKDKTPIQSLIKTNIDNDFCFFHWTE